MIHATHAQKKANDKLQTDAAHYCENKLAVLIKNASDAGMMHISSTIPEDLDVDRVVAYLKNYKYAVNVSDREIEISWK